MITDVALDLLIERYVERVYKMNTIFLKGVGESIRKIRTLTPTQAHQLVEILKYGGSYDEIVKKISKQTNLSIQEIDEIFAEVAKMDLDFAEQFYKYRNIPFKEYEKNETLKRHVQSLARIAKEEFFNFANSSAIGYSIRDSEGNILKLGLRETYERILDEAILNVSRGVTTFDYNMSKILKSLGRSGLKYLDYESGRSIRLDSMVRQHMNNAIRNLHNEIELDFGKEFDSDGVEISVHQQPAPDHMYVQGRQFSNEEFEKFQTNQDCVSYEGISFPAISEETGRDRRSISEYNCRHYIYSIVLGVSQPNFTEKALQNIIDKNEKGFELDGIHYTGYEGTQLQRKLEREIRTQKDLQILGRSSRNKEMILDAQEKISQLTYKYKELSNISGLKTRMDRLRVGGYKRIAKSKLT